LRKVSARRGRPHNKLLNRDSCDARNLVRSAREITWQSDC
jgi:hypothetical protein